MYGTPDAVYTAGLTWLLSCLTWVLAFIGQVHSGIKSFHDLIVEYTVAPETSVPEATVTRRRGKRIRRRGGRNRGYGNRPRIPPPLSADLEQRLDSGSFSIFSRSLDGLTVSLSQTLLDWLQSRPERCCQMLVSSGAPLCIEANRQTLGARILSQISSVTRPMMRIYHRLGNHPLFTGSRDSSDENTVCTANGTFTGNHQLPAAPAPEQQGPVAPEPQGPVFPQGLNQELVLSSSFWSRFEPEDWDAGRRAVPLTRWKKFTRKFQRGRCRVVEPYLGLQMEAIPWGELGSFNQDGYLGETRVSDLNGCRYRFLNEPEFN